MSLPQLMREMKQQESSSGRVARTSGNALREFISTLPDKGTPWEEQGGLFSLPGPHKLKDRYSQKIDALVDFQTHNQAGKNIVFAEKLALQFGDDTAINMVLPTVIFVKQPFIADLVAVADPRDAARIARLHVKKSLVYGESSTFLGDGVLSTRDVDSWQEQRTNLVEGFLPLAALAKVMPVSVQRANYAVEQRLRKIVGQPVDICEFYLFEAMTQLHLALFGESTEFSETNNVRLRQSFNTMMVGPFGSSLAKWKEDRAFIRNFSKQILEHTRNERGDTIKSAPFRSEMLNCPVIGPVAAKLAENTPTSVADPLAAQRDSVSTISFAGFDTTALNMTWVTFEMCRRPELQKRVQAEVDEVYDSLNGRPLEYADLAKFKFLTRVINETLRLWTSVPNGTFREIQFDDYIEGPNGQKVKLPAGTQVWVPTFLLHRSEKLWGKDALEFNPDREWLPEESWFGQPFGATNPSSHRFAPFTFPPRGCIGMNFAQMESRVILSKVFYEYNLEFAEPTKAKAAMAHTREHFLGVNRGTMMPEGGMWVNATPRHRTSKI